MMEQQKATADRGFYTKNLRKGSKQAEKLQVE